MMFSESSKHPFRKDSRHAKEGVEQTLDGLLGHEDPAAEDAVPPRYQLAGIVVFHERQGRVRQGAPLLDVVEAVDQDPGEDRDGVHGVLAVAELEMVSMASNSRIMVLSLRSSTMVSVR